MATLKQRFQIHQIPSPGSSLAQAINLAVLTKNSGGSVCMDSMSLAAKQKSYETFHTKRGNKTPDYLNFSLMTISEIQANMQSRSTKMNTLL